jgi:hypothetical protein
MASSPYVPRPHTMAEADATNMRPVRTGLADAQPACVVGPRGGPVDCAHRVAGRGIPCHGGSPPPVQRDAIRPHWLRLVVEPCLGRRPRQRVFTVQGPCGLEGRDYNLRGAVDTIWPSLLGTVPEFTAASSQPLGAVLCHGLVLCRHPNAYTLCLGGKTGLPVCQPAATCSEAAKAVANTWHCCGSGSEYPGGQGALDAACRVQPCLVWYSGGAVCALLHIYPPDATT